MEPHFQLSDIDFEQAFASTNLDPALFSHEAHLRLAWIHITKYGVDRAIDNITRQLKAFVTQLGAEDKYNTTLTIAAVRTVYHFILKSKSECFVEFIQEFPRLKTGFRALLFCHYRTDIFKSEEAKHTYLEPELLPFD